ncbi:cytochrome c oxidase subunit 3 [Ruegeria aquimaris]|uniref:Cytochrome c oxidase subunit 3 n=1 Tax=Ruegeria aquimaris TaxID=2984333 RepID=A0ABT3APT3_9RHOB|nr:cytochrome c oxidase subunit 3 [Ruegeria sp. XHP0148]MCV2890272.1 cytochrome c oxidase subunit 3 [Ruegeria sp. XHP0148]
MKQTSGIDALPGELLMWVLIFSELLVFGVGLLAFMAVRLTDPSGFAEAQSALYRTGAALNTAVLVTSGFLAAKALEYRRKDRRAQARLSLVAAAALGCVFLIVKGAEYAGKAAQGISYETHPFFMFYYLLTGFHAAHVLAGVMVLLLVAWRDETGNIEAGAQFWHMVDLIWVLLFPVVYLLG